MARTNPAPYVGPGYEPHGPGGVSKQATGNQRDLGDAVEALVLALEDLCLMVNEMPGRQRPFMDEIADHVVDARAALEGTAPHAHRVPHREGH